MGLKLILEVHRSTAMMHHLTQLFAFDFLTMLLAYR